jgi:hypothetical protein
VEVHDVPFFMTELGCQLSMDAKYFIICMSLLDFSFKLLLEEYQIPFSLPPPPKISVVPQSSFSFFLVYPVYKLIFRLFLNF